MTARPGRRRLWLFLGTGLLVALLLAGVGSSFASDSPDGLDYAARQGCTFDQDDAVTGGDCMAREARDHDLAGSPLADYGVRDIGDAFLSSGVSGVAGVVVVFAVGSGLFWLLGRRAGRRTSGAPPSGVEP